MGNYVLAYSFSRETGEYTGEVNAWESPLEPGVFLLPDFATFDAPPPPQENKYRKWDGEKWIFVEIPAPAQPIEPTIDELKAEVRLQRNGLLSACDWTQLPDVPLSSQQRQAWVVYRQCLRDVTKQSGFPNSIIWPIEPEG